MDRLSVCASMLVGAALSCACSGDGNEGKPGEGGKCSTAGTTFCGLAASGQEAVLVCAAGLTWEAQDVCAGQCVLLGDGQYGCWTEGDVALQDGDGAPGDVLREGEISDVVQGNELPDETGGPEIPDTTPQEVEFKDMMPDFTPPWVETTSPASDEMEVSIPFAVTITFTEPIHKPTVAENTVKMEDAAGKSVKLLMEFSPEDGAVLVLTPQGAVFNSSPYTITLSGSIRDLAGNQMGNSYEFTFYTSAVPTLGFYRTLAGKFAPLIYQATNPEFPQYDYLAAFNLDGDWVAEDNVEYIKGSAVTVTPQVHYSVTETKSHYFITYAFFYPYRYAENPGDQFGNDVSGAMVLVSKPDETPIALETWFTNGFEDERSFAFVVDGSELVPPGKTFTDFKFHGSYDPEDLFPNGHFVSYLSARKHESCSWLLEGNSYLDGCELNLGLKTQMQKIEYRYGDGEVTPIGKEGGKFPQAKEKVLYGLTHLLDSWWARRGDVGQDKMWANTYKYEPHTSTVFKNRPQLTVALPSLFVDPGANDLGRPPWAWAWAPGNGDPYYEMPRGVLFLDPAVHFKQRHDQSNTWAGFDPGTKSGWSLEYCFNPYFSLDFRGIWAECSAPEP